MKTSISTIGILCFLLILSGSSPDTAPSEGPVFMTAHDLRLTSGQEQELVRTLRDFNQFFSHYEYPNIRYRLWKITGKPSGEYTHRWDAVWPDTVVYLKVHQIDAYKKVIEQHRAFLEEIMKNQTHTQYFEVVGNAERKQ